MARKALIKGEQRQGSSSGSPGQDELVRQIASLPKVLQSIDHRVNVIHHNTPGADEALQQIVAGGPIKVIAPQHPGHLGQHHILEINTSRSHGSKESPFCDRRLLGVITDQQTHDHIGIKGLHD